MGRPERPIEDAAGDLGGFAQALRQLRADADRPTYQAMARDSTVSRSALAEAAAGRRLPRWRTVEHYVRYCNGDVDEWRRRWEAVKATPPDQRGEEPIPEAADEGASGHRPRLAGTSTEVFRRRRAVTVVVALAIVVVVGGAGAVLLALRSDGTDAPPSATEQPVFSEDFDGDQLNLQKWFAPSDPSHVYPRDNVLNMIGSISPGESVNVDLVSQDIGTFREIDFVIRVLNYPNPGSGGGSLVLTEQGGRTQKFVFGPSPGPIPLIAAVLSCARSTCNQYDDYEPPPPSGPAEQFVVGEVVPIKIIQNGSTLTYWMRNVVIGRADVSEPLAAFRFNAYAEPGEQWHLMVDAVRVYR